MPPKRRARLTFRKGYDSRGRSTRGSTSSNIPSANPNHARKIKVEKDLIAQINYEDIGFPKDLIKSVCDKCPGLEYKSVCLTLQKINKNQTFVELGSIFGVSEAKVKNDFTKSLFLLSQLSEKLISTSFQKSNYVENSNQEIQFILDCWEMMIKTATGKSSLKMNKNYKIKYLISSSSDGFFNFISSGFEGSTCNRDIAKSSGFLEQVPEKCALIADGGFANLQPLLIGKRIRLIVVNNKYGSKETHCRRLQLIYLERIIRWCRNYKILRQDLAVCRNLTSYMDHIIKILCGLFNLQIGKSKIQ